MSHGQPIEAAVLGELAPDAEASFRAHLGGCDACRAEYEERRALAALLFAEDGAPTEKARLFAALPPEATGSARAGWWRWALGAALASAVAVVAAVGLGPRPAVDDVALRGGDERPRADVSLSVYAKRDGEPVRLVAEFPGSAEGAIGLEELVQLRFNYLNAQLGQASVDLTPLGRAKVCAPGAAVAGYAGC